MRKTLASILVVPAILAAPISVAHADHAPLRPAIVALGVAGGDPSAIDLKFWINHHSGFDFGLGFSRWSSRVGVYGEFELGLADFWIGDDASGVFYIGVGGAIALRYHRDDLAVALVIPIGINFRFRAPIEVFLELRPGFELLDTDGFGLGAQVGIRYVF